jgi:S-adenosylmethionine synthetase
MTLPRPNNDNNLHIVSSCFIKSSPHLSPHISLRFLLHADHASPHHGHITHITSGRNRFASGGGPLIRPLKILVVHRSNRILLWEFECAQDKTLEKVPKNRILFSSAKFEQMNRKSVHIRQHSHGIRRLF